LLPVRRRLLFLGKIGAVANVGQTHPEFNPAEFLYRIGASCPTPRAGGIRDSGLCNRRCPSQVGAESRCEPAQNRPPDVRRFRRRRLRKGDPTSLKIIQSDEYVCLPFRPPICAVTSESGVVSGRTVTAHPFRATLRIRRRVLPGIECGRPRRGRT
jgi:hypothetical protein